jgi:hypothetical protein
MANIGTQNSFKHFSAVQLLESSPGSERFADLFGAFHFVAMQVDRRRRYRSAPEIVAYRCQLGAACQGVSCVRMSPMSLKR